MILLADSGSTKTQWALIGSSSSEPLFFPSPGLNPITSSPASLRQGIESVSHWVGDRCVDEVRFYGAGCGTAEACRTMEALLGEQFLQANILVGSDMLGACIAVLGHEPGTVGILGTGSNACLYDGNAITHRLPSLGYALGDEGSGNHLGRLLLKAYFEERMPSDLRYAFSNEYNIEYKSVIDSIYHLPSPNTFLASLAPFANKHRIHPYIKNLLSDSFQQYFEHIVQPLGSTHLRLVGSIAYHFYPELLQAADSMSITIDTPPLQSPIQGLVAQCRK